MNKFKRLFRHDLPLHFVLVFTNWFPDSVVLMKLRGRMARPFFKSCGKGLTLGRNVVFYNPGKISIGDDVYIAYNNWFGAGDHISIGNKVLFGPGCVLASSSHVFFNDNFSEASKADESEIIISDGCWIAANVNIAGKCTIGKGSLVAAGCNVKGEYPDFVMIAGSKGTVKKHLK